MFEYNCTNCHKTFHYRKRKHGDRAFCSKECWTAYRVGENHPNKKAWIPKICPICNEAFKVTPSWTNAQFCSRKCHYRNTRRVAQGRVEAHTGKPIRELLTEMYYDQRLGIKKISVLLGISDSTLWLWFDDLDIPRRDRSSAVEIQWENNEERRMSQSTNMRRLQRTGIINNRGKNSPMRRKELRKKFSAMRKGAGNPMYNRLGPDNPSWQGGKVKDRGPGWRSYRMMAIRRDRGCCVRCGSTKQLEVHHIVPYRETQDNSLENLITLCHACHDKVEHRAASWQIQLLTD